MRRPEWIARQSSHPRGLVGRVLARIMASETALVNKHALELLHIRPTDRVLEVGCGHGRTIARAASIARQGVVAGIDVSAEMVRMATQWNHLLIQDGRVELQQADSARIPYDDESFDRIYTVHTLYFWDDPHAHLREMYRVMKDGARIVLGFRSREDKRGVANFPSTIYQFYTGGEVSDFLNDVGFSRIQILNQRIGSSVLTFGVAHRMPS
jgi:ubiquinone/menaquinone biosynthesis C-methylase UbiE